MKLLLLDRPLNENIVRERDVEFFGPWAQPIHSPDELSKTAFEPYPDHQSVYRVSLEVMRVAEGILEILSDALPALTGVPAGERFWRTYLGFHVTMLAGIVEDIKHRRASLPEKDYILGVPAGAETQVQVPYSWRDTWQYLQFCDDFKWHVMSISLKEHYHKQELVPYLRFPLRKIVKKSDEIYTKFLQSGHRRIFRKMLSVLPHPFGFSAKSALRQNTLPSLVWDRYQMEDFDFKKLDAAFFPEWYNKAVKPRFIPCVDKKKRAGLKESLPKPYGELFSETLPLLDLEGLPHMVKLVKDSGLRTYENIERIYTHGQAFADDGARRVLFSLLADAGKNTVAIQHGIGHAYFAHSGLLPERVIADEHIYWGRGYTDGAQKARVLPSIYLSRLKQKLPYIAYARKKRIWDALFVVLEENRYIKWLYSPLFPDLAEDYFKRQKKLFDYFCVKAHTAIKIYPVTYGWGQFDWIKARYPRARVFNAGKFVNYAHSSKLVIVDYLGSSLLEILAMGTPFLACWNRRWFRGVRRFEEHLDKLIEAGVFYERPEELIQAYITKIRPDTAAWWQDDKRQGIIKAMAEDFALTSNKVNEEWQEEFLKR